MISPKIVLFLHSVNDLDIIVRPRKRHPPFWLPPERQGRVVECRFFGGMSVDETAEVLGVSGRTVKLDWAVAKAWLFRELTGDGPAPVSHGKE